MRNGGPPERGGSGAELATTVASDHRWGMLPLRSSFFPLIGLSVSSGVRLAARRLK